MKDIKTIEGDLHPRDARFVIIASRFNEFVVNALIKGSLDCLSRHGVCLLYTSPSPRDLSTSRMPSSA